MLEPKVQAVNWHDSRVVMLDQTRIPLEETYLRVAEHTGVIDAIKRLAVRGAPAIGVAGAYAVVLAVKEVLDFPFGDRENAFLVALENIAHARPTAVNLRWAVGRMKARWEALGRGLSERTVDALLIEAKAIHDEDLRANLKMAELGASLLKQPVGAMTYCNTGDLATSGVGTAFGVLNWGFRTGKVSHVYACETRPVMQGMRLTVWELEKNRIPFTLLCDNMAALLMRDGKIGAVFTGADRVAANGDSANKVGTYTLAVLARYHRIPFYIVAPTSTFDLAIENGTQIPIEERDSEEILGVLGKNRHSFTVPVVNPSFDVTPHDLITAIVCEKGVIESPNREQVQSVLSRAGSYSGSN